MTIREAAERLTRNLLDMPPNEFDKAVADVPLLARAYLADNHADDEMAVDLAWLNSLSRKGGDMSFLCVRLCDDGFHLMSPCNSPHEGIDGLRDYVAPSVATRGDVRRLAKCLGITLEEAK